jgi:hypothetical protein
MRLRRASLRAGGVNGGLALDDKPRRSLGWLLARAAAAGVAAGLLAFAATHARHAGFHGAPLSLFAGGGEEVRSVALAFSAPLSLFAGGGDEVRSVALAFSAPQPLRMLTGLAAPAVVAAPEACNLLPRAELHAPVVRAGENASDAAACCAACAAHGECNVWVYCSDARRCGAAANACWLKRADKPEALHAAALAGGARADAWTSGVLLPSGGRAAQPVGAAARARAAQRAAGLTLLRGAHLLVGLRNATGTIELLSPLDALIDPENAGFSFVLPLRDDGVRLDGNAPLDRSADGFHHLGDFTLRAQAAADDALVTCSSVADGQMAAETAAAWRVDSDDAGWRAARRAPLAASCPVEVTRTLTSDARTGHLTLRWEVRNPALARHDVTLLDFGASMPFDQLFAGRSLPQVAASASFMEPFLGGGGGHVVVTRAHGGGPGLLLLPLDASTRFEAWRPLREKDKQPPGFMYENTYELAMHTAGYAAREWRDAHGGPWNAATAATIPPGGAITRGLRIVLLPGGPASLEAALLREGRPVVRAMPGAVIHADMRTAALELLLPPMLRDARADVVVVPREAPLRVRPCMQIAAPHPQAAAVLRCALEPDEAAMPPDGARARLDVALSARNGSALLSLSAHFFVAAPAPALVAALGAHASGAAYMPATAADPWRRAPACFGWDARDGGRAATAEVRVFMSGLSDEAGAAAPLAAAVKAQGAPVVAEVAALEAYAHETLFQGDAPQRRDFLQSAADHGVRSSMLYWNDSFNDAASPAGSAATAAAPELARVCRECWRGAAEPGGSGGCNWMVCWSEARSLETWRAYNYPHVTATWWSLYRLARWHDPPLTTRATWEFYLARAADTAIATYDLGGDPWSKTAGGGRGTASWGLMVGSVYEALLRDLRREGRAWTARADRLQRTVGEARAASWLAQPFPYGSEFAWDSTGHEEIATWLRAFGFAAQADQTARAVTAYVTLSAHWAYSGSARRWWDFGINGVSYGGNERTFHHYAAALNAVPLFDAALAARGRDAWLWRLAGAATGGSLTNIGPGGAPSMGWHADPERLFRDAYSGDFGIGFYGYEKNAGAYISCSADAGWLCIGCDVLVEEQEMQGADELARCGGALRLRVTPRDAFRRRLYLQPLGLLLQLDGGVVDEAHVRLSGGSGAGRASLTVRPSPSAASAAMLTLRADGDAHATGAPTAARLRCAAGCALGPAPFAASAGGHETMLRLRFAGAAAATLELEADALAWLEP